VWERLHYLRRAPVAHGEHEKRQGGEDDVNWPDWYAAPRAGRPKAVGKVRPGGTLLFMSGTGGRRPTSGALIAAHTAGVPALVRNLALEVAPIRVNVIAPGFVDTPLPRSTSVISSTSAASSFAARCRSDGSSNPTTSPRWQCT
jgi:NAD(P)-dependent dehydrogenase (short-subunit alcohol dehydrogenase family)